MARLQDFQQVTPTNSDNILIVQSTGQGLATVGSTLGAKMDKANPTGTGALSLNRASGSTIGAYSVAEGLSCTASGQRSHAEGSANTASGLGSHSEGGSNQAQGDYSHAEGNACVASGLISHAEGQGTVANHLCQHAFGRYNVADPSTAAATLAGNYIEIVGKGATDGTRSNARTLDWSGNEVLAGDLTFKGNISLNTLTTLLQGMNTFRIAANSSKNVTVVADSNSNFSFLVVGIGRTATLTPILMHVGGYVTASRSIVTNITGITGLTVDNSSTTDLKFVFTNTSSSVYLDVRLIPLFDNTFTVT